MELTNAIIARLRLPDGALPLVSRVELERERTFGVHNDAATLVVYVSRKMTLDGGDGRHGFDASDFDALERAVDAVVKEVGGYGMVTGFVVRESVATIQ
jgi:hypothetical protein